MPPTEQKIKTSAGMETATETVSRIQGQLATPSQNVPISSIESTGPGPLTMPEIKPSTVNAAGAISSAEQLTGSIQEMEAQRMTQEKQAAESKVSESEMAIRNAAGILSTQGAKRNEMEAQAGLPKAQEQLRAMSSNLAMATADLRQFDLEFTNSMEAMRVDMGKRDLTKRTFGAASAEANQQMAVQRAGMVASVYSQQAGIMLLQDNVKMATEAIDKALTAHYEPIRAEMEMEKMFYQRNSQLFDSAQNREANARLKVIEQQQNEIDRAQSLADSAVSAGFANADDIEKFTEYAKDPETLAAYSRMLISRGVRAAQAAAAAKATGDGTMKAPTIKTINGVDYQWNDQTGKWESVDLPGATGALDETSKTVDQLTFLREVASSATDLANKGGILRTPVGPSLINRAIGDTLVGNTSFRQLQNKSDVLKTNVLSLMTDPTIKKFFGPQMSNADVRLMMSAGSQLDPQNQTKKDYVAEVQRLDDLLNRMQTAVTSGAQSSTMRPNVLVAPDGQQIEIID